MKKIPVAIIGLGRIASLLEEDSRREKPCTHAGAIAANPDCVLVGGCDIDEKRRELFAERWRVPVYADAAVMLNVVVSQGTVALQGAQKPEILVIATHPDSHYHYCRLGAEMGVPVIICEKPLADTISAARKIAGLARPTGPMILCNHERRYSADYIKAKKILAEGELGRILSARAILYMGKDQRLVDVFWHDGTHLADALMFLTESVLKHKKRWGARLNASSGTAWLEGTLEGTHGSIPVIFDIGAGRDHLVFEIEFSCKKGRLRIGNGVFEVWQSDESPYAEKFRSLKLTETTFNGPTGYFANMIADAVSIIREPGRQPVSSAADGLRVIEYLYSVKAWR
jgi:predicted dehydrogenase